MTQTDQLQHVWHMFQQENGYIPSSGREAVEWGVAQGLCSLPQTDPMDILAKQLSRALREEYATDAKGRRYRVNHAVRVSANGVQFTFWGILGFAPHEHMEQAFTQRREQIVGDAFQLKTDVDVYNDMNQDRPPIQLDLNFTEDVQEREVALDLIDLDVKGELVSA